MKTTIDLPETLLRRVKAEAALGGLKLREYVAEALRLRLGTREAAAPIGDPEPLLKDLGALPLVKRGRGAGRLKVTPKRVHELEMEAELARNDASLR